ncbi:MAG: imidazolonepropionase [Pseudomonadota bacterium]
MNKSLVINNISRLVTMEPGPNREGELGVIIDAAVRIEDGRVQWVGKQADLPASSGDIVDAKRAVVLPGLVDCHTHIVHGGFRQQEFNLRSQGKTYQEIAKQGGGIMSSVKSTRESSEKDLVHNAKARLDEALSFGTTTLEIKTGYGLDLDTEMKMVRVIEKLNEDSALSIKGTFLGAHVVPAEYKDKRDEYVKLVIDNMLSQAASSNAISACDVFVEEGAFTSDEARAIAKRAKELGLNLHVHVDQFTDSSGGVLAAELGALSADHLDYTTEKGASAMAKAGVVGVLLPGASFFTGHGAYPNAKMLKKNGVKLAIATDYNPGTNPSLNLWLAATIAITQMGMSCDDALLGITKHAAQALGIKDAGKVAKGVRADLLLLDALDEYFPLYRYGVNFVKAVIIDSKLVSGEL